MNTFSYLPRIVLSTVMALSLWAFTPTGVSATSAPMAESVDTYEQTKDRDPSGYVLQVTGEGGVPTDGVTAVALNVTVTATETGAHDGFVTVFPCGDRPDASNLNFVANQTVPNLVIAPVSDAGEVCLYVYGRAHLIVDVSGYFTTGIEPLAPTRLLDTRGGDKVGALDGNGNIHRLHVTGSNGIPADGVTAVAMNVTATETATGAHGGFVTVFPCGTRPEASNLNFVANQTVPNLVIAPVNDAGDVCFYTYGEAHLLADVSGYFTTGIETLTPTRLLDTRPTPGSWQDDKVGDFDGTTPTNRTEACIQDYSGCLNPAVWAYIDDAWTIADYQPSFPVNRFKGDRGWTGPCMSSECTYFSAQRIQRWQVSEKPPFEGADSFTTFADNWCPGQSTESLDGTAYWASCNSGRPEGGHFEVKWEGGILTVEWRIPVAVAPGYDSWSDWYRGTQGDFVEACAKDVEVCLSNAVSSYATTTWEFDYPPSTIAEPTTTEWTTECDQATCETVSLQQDHTWDDGLNIDDVRDIAALWCLDTPVETYGYFYSVNCAANHEAGGEYELTKWGSYTVRVEWSSAEAPGFNSWADWYRNEGKNL